MKKRTTQSVSFTIGGAVSLMVILSALTIIVAVATVYSSFDDAEAVNVSGSMRMQSYRLAYDIETDSPETIGHIEQFETSLFSPSMQNLIRWNVPTDIQEDYQSIVDRWHVMKDLLLSGRYPEYQQHVPVFVSRIDKFVFKLQLNTEQKLLNMVVFSGFGLTCIILISLVIMRFVRLKVLQPLQSLVNASKEVESQNFNVVLNESVNNELGAVASTFNGMTQNLKNHYQRLEATVENKTEELRHANRSLKVLYKSTQQLSASRLAPAHFQQIISNMATVENVDAVKLIIDDSAGQPTELIEGVVVGDEWQETPLILDEVRLGSLCLQTTPQFAEQELIDNMSYILARGIYYNQAQKKFEQLLIYAERSAIARELHDSLAQSLSFLKIQMSLLKRSMKKECSIAEMPKSSAIVQEIDDGLREAYTQLRELLGTFRFSIDEANFGDALNVLIEKLQTTTDAEIHVENNLSSIQLQASQQVHLLQIIREATNNAIKHAEASILHVQCLQEGDQITVAIIDNGQGFDTEIEKADHYGLSILNERSQYLNGKLTITSEPSVGSTVQITFTCKDESDSE
ncbi:nitrate/nitrite two-component system sensor histidine kinase NarQ [Vibrio breoganii]|uniref:nitrate/nitrite two-component system sensor histidine kinase NarQ n=1 Tax=Vibrio breoganii TaxID=553239 RepID=UPI000C85B45E|nr:nitrate/nitrite two-component system sensor histidine kinase NarQ [Vibrio breoganii]PML98107.1 two-component system sensor histidine kinase NarQ [Vibrio breoganii]PMM17477.1 two-component system sensor histidine kinase NarQ [Vibrio breoganii]PMN64561.1 two-component system sensor histidine kinase NarQ [Vibrio breoganii]